MMKISSARLNILRKWETLYVLYTIEKRGGLDNMRRRQVKLS